MKLRVTGEETIEITDPRGLCDQGKPTGGIPIGQPLNPINIPIISPQPMIPTPFSPTPLPTRPWNPGETGLPPTIYKKDHGKKWQVGYTGDPQLPVHQTADGEKWTRNMQLATAGEELKAGQTLKEGMSGNYSTTYTS